MEILKKFFLLIIIIMLILPLVFFNIKKDAISELNNSKLPNIDENTIFHRSIINDYLNERIGFHDFAVTLNMKIKKTLFGKLEHPLYEEGQDNYMFFHFDNHSVSEKYVDEFCQYLKVVQDKCKSKGIPFIYCINPYKLTVYQDKAAVGYNYKNEFLDYLYYYLKKYNINYISNVELLQEKSKKEQVFNVVNDAGHWNDLGQFYGTNNLLEKVNEYFPNVKSHELSDFKIEEYNAKYLRQSKIEINEKTPHFTNKNDAIDITDNFKDVKLSPHYNHFLCYRNPKISSQKPRVLFFHGSYYERSAEFYKDSFYEIVTVHNYENFLNIDYFLNKFNPDCVILETAEYATSPTYFPEDIIKKRLSGNDEFVDWE